MEKINTNYYFLIQPEVKPKPLTTRSHPFSRALRQLYEFTFTMSFDWLTGLSVFFVIG